MPLLQVQTNESKGPSSKSVPVTFLPVQISPNYDAYGFGQETRKTNETILECDTVISMMKNLKKKQGRKEERENLK